MISGGNATVFVSNMDKAVRFYTEVLGLRLAERYGDHWATVDAGRGFTIGLHPASPKYPAPGTKGGIMLGLYFRLPVRELNRRHEILPLDVFNESVETQHAASRQIAREHARVAGRLQ
jgi:catechol 2,3-dioxygenase-like lactoylglutathione lyase family enzyme